LEVLYFPSVTASALLSQSKVNPSLLKFRQVQAIVIIIFEQLLYTKAQQVLN